MLFRGSFLTVSSLNTLRVKQLIHWLANRFIKSKNLILIRLNFSSEWRWPDVTYYLRNSLHQHRSVASSFLKQFFSCFFQHLFPPFYFWSALSFSIHFIYHCLHQNIFLRSSQNMTILPHTIRPCQLICFFLLSQHVHQLLCIPLVHQLHTTHRPYHRSFCSSQNSFFIFSQTPRLASI